MKISPYVGTLCHQLNTSLFFANISIVSWGFKKHHELGDLNTTNKTSKQPSFIHKYYCLGYFNEPMIEGVFHSLWTWILKPNWVRKMIIETMGGSFWCCYHFWVSSYSHFKNHILVSILEHLHPCSKSMFGM